MSVASRANTIVWNKLVKRLASASAMRVHVGVLAGAGGETVHPDSGLTMIELAAIHEFGSPAAGIPERSFIRATANRDDVTKKLGVLAKRLTAQMAEGKRALPQALGLMGLFLVTEIKRTIVQRKTEGPDTQANAPSTIARKGSTTPLVDTGRLINAITWLIVAARK